MKEKVEYFLRPLEAEILKTTKNVQPSSSPKKCNYKTASTFKLLVLGSGAGKKLLKRVKKNLIFSSWKLVLAFRESFSVSYNSVDTSGMHILLVEQLKNITQQNTLNNTSQDKTRQDKTRQDITSQHNTTQRNATQHSTSQHNTTHHNTTQHNTTQHKTSQHNTTHHNTTQHNTSQHNTTHHITTQHSTAQQHSTTW